MQGKSPLFQSAIELLAHALLHLKGSQELDRKLAILHLANAVELIVKDILLNKGHSIYKNPKETLSVYGAIAQLKEIMGEPNLPRINIIELLIDERNSLQHRFGSPNEITAIFYGQEVLKFFREVLDMYYGRDLDTVMIEHINDEEHIDAYMLFSQDSAGETSELDTLQRLANVHPLAALLPAIARYEKNIGAFIKKTGLAPAERFKLKLRSAPQLLETLIRAKIDVPKNIIEEATKIEKLYSKAMRGSDNVTADEVKEALLSIKKVERFLDGIDAREVGTRFRGLLTRIDEDRRELRRRHGQLVRANKEAGIAENTLTNGEEINFLDDDDLPF